MSCSRDATVKFWDLETGHCGSTVGSGDWLRCIDVSADGLFVATGGNEKVVLVLEASTGRVAHELSGHEHFIQCLSFSKRLATRGGVASGGTSEAEPAAESRVVLLASGARDSTVIVWNVALGEILLTFREHTNWVNDVVFTKDGKYIMSCSDDRSIKVMDVAKRRRVRDLESAHEHFVTSLAPMPSIGRLASGGADKELRLWEC